jgi:chorismate dehydratase
LRIGQVSYLNTRPVYYGLEQGAVTKGEEWSLIEGTPSALNSKLSSGELDISVVSSVEYARHWRDYRILPHLCIGSDGEVKSVLFFSKLPLKELEGKEVWLTKSSLTSKTLVKWIFEEKGVTPLYREFALGEEVFLNTHTQAVLLIGDEALKKRESGIFPYVLDLGSYWKGKTGLPFVFALWCVRSPVVQAKPKEVTRVWRALLSSREYSMSRLEEISCLCHSQVSLSQAQCRDYLRRLDFDLTSAHIQGMKLFFSILEEKSLIPQKPPLNFFPPLEEKL